MATKAYYACLNKTSIIILMRHFPFQESRCCDREVEYECTGHCTLYNQQRGTESNNTRRVEYKLSLHGPNLAMRSSVC